MAEKYYTRKEMMEKFDLSYHVLQAILNINCFEALLVGKKLRYGKTVFFIDVLPESNVSLFNHYLKKNSQYINSLK